MISCQYIPENKTALEFITEKAREVDLYENKVCLIVPTERNLRYLAGCGFRYVDIFSLSNFYNAAIEYEKILLPKELRPYYLLKAVQKLSKDEVYTVFKSNNEEFITSFLSFAKNSKNIFAFYRELFSENVSVDELSKAALYSDYEAQITILNKLWDIYVELIHNDNYMDKWESFSSFQLNDLFIESYNEYIFLINGFLTKYELSFIKQISQKQNVLVVFNYAGNLHTQHKEYEKFFETSALKDKEMPVFSNGNTQIYECESNLSQIELITKKAFEINQKHNIPFNKMAVVMPDTSCKPYFIMLDVYKLFDVSAGDEMSNTRIYTLLENLINIYEDLYSFNNTPINNIITLFSDSFLLAIDEISNIVSECNKLIENNRQYINKDDLCNISFIKKYFYELLNADKTMTINKTANIYKTLLKNLKDILTIEKDEIQKCIIAVEKVSTTYKNIKDEVSFLESSHLILSEIMSLSIDLPKREIAVTGILETRNMNYDIIFMPFMTEELFPPKSSKDLFINTEIRNQLNLPTYIDRENLMKNYCFQIINHAKLTIFSYSDELSSIRRSSFIEEIIVKNNLKVEYFSPKEISLIKTDTYHYNIKDNEISIEKTDDVVNHLKNFTYSASALNVYKSCSLKFYFKYILNIDKGVESVESLDNQIFGIIIHNVFKELHNKGITPHSDKYKDEFKKEFTKLIKSYDAYNHSKVEQFIATFIYNTLEQIVNAEITHTNEGYEILDREKCITATFNRFNIKGFLDKVEIKDNKIYVTDYKYKDIKNIKIIKDDNFDNVDDIQLVIYAILIEKEMKKLPENIFYFSIKEDFKYFEGFDMELYDKYKVHIKNMLNEIVDKNINFTQTDKLKNCDFCPYNNICGRNNGFFAK